MPCDICGRNNRAVLTEMEGAKLYVCRDCNPTMQGVVKRDRPKKTFTPKKFDKKKTDFKNIKRKAPRAKKGFTHKRYSGFKLDDFDLVENYGKLIRDARDSKKLSIEDLAKKIKESSTYLNKVEQQKLKPSDKLALKLFDFLGVNIIDAKEEEIEDKAQSDQKEQEDVKKDISDDFTEVSHNNKRKIII